MKGYIRKIISIVLVLVFCAAVIIGACVILSVKNVNIEYIYYSSSDDEVPHSAQEFETASDNLNALKGQNMLFLSDEEITSCVYGNMVYIESFEKIFPCTINVVLRERREQYAKLNSSDLYDIYDTEGKYIETRSQNINPADNSPDVLLNVDDQAFEAAVEMCSYFKDCFGSLRNLVQSVTSLYDPVLDTANLTFRLYSGLTIVIYDYDEYAEEKMNEVYDEYERLSESQKLRGSIYAVSINDDADGDYAAYYNPDLNN